MLVVFCSFEYLFVTYIGQCAQSHGSNAFVLKDYILVGYYIRVGRLGLGISACVGINVAYIRYLPVWAERLEIMHVLRAHSATSYYTDFLFRAHRL